jgi:hypothetical protein
MPSDVTLSHIVDRSIDAIENGMGCGRGTMRAAAQYLQQMRMFRGLPRWDDNALVSLLVALEVIGRVAGVRIDRAAVALDRAMNDLSPEPQNGGV